MADYSPVPSSEGAQSHVPEQQNNQLHPQHSFIIETQDGPTLSQSDTQQTGHLSSPIDIDAFSCMGLDDFWTQTGDSHNLLCSFGLDLMSETTATALGLQVSQVASPCPWPNETPPQVSCHGLNTGQDSNATASTLNNPSGDFKFTQSPLHHRPHSASKTPLAIINAHTMIQQTGDAHSHRHPPSNVVGLETAEKYVSEFEEYINMPSTATSVHPSISSSTDDPSTPHTDGSSNDSSFSSSLWTRTGGKKLKTMSFAAAAEEGEARQRRLAVKSSKEFRNLVLVITARYYRNLAKIMELTAPDVMHEAMMNDQSGVGDGPSGVRWTTAVESVSKVISSLVADAPPVSPPSLSFELSSVNSKPNLFPPYSSPRSRHEDFRQVQLEAKNYSGVWSESEIQHLRDLATKSKILTGRGRVNWDYVTQRFEGRNRRQILLKATQLGLKKPSTRIARRLNQRRYKYRLEMMMKELGEGDSEGEPMGSPIGPD